MQLNKKVFVGLGACVAVGLGTLIFLSMDNSQADLPSKSPEKLTVTSQKALDFEQLKTQGFWFDKVNKRLWYRCHLGQTFNGKQCEGEAEPIAFYQAQAQINKLNQTNWQGINHWRLADIHELHGLIECSTGFIDQTNLPSKNQVSHGCKPNGYHRPTINQNIFLATKNDWYWSATPYQAASAGAAKTVWGAYFSSGYVYDLSVEQKGYVYIVSSIQ